MADTYRLEQRLRATVGDPAIQVVPRAVPFQIVCRERDEDLVRELATRYAPGQPVQVVGL